MTREEAIKCIRNILKGREDKRGKTEIDIALDMAIKALEQQSKTGHWIEHQHERGENWQYSRYECSVCHNWANFDNDFCPNCGCRMIEQQENEE